MPLPEPIRKVLRARECVNRRHPHARNVFCGFGWKGNPWRSHPADKFFFLYFSLSRYVNWINSGWWRTKGGERKPSSDGKRVLSCNGGSLVHHKRWLNWENGSGVWAATELWRRGCRLTCFERNARKIKDKNRACYYLWRLRNWNWLSSHYYHPLFWFLHNDIPRLRLRLPLNRAPRPSTVSHQT